MSVGFNPSYTGPRSTLAALIPSHTRTVLDVGCATGGLGAGLKEAMGTSVVGIEGDASMAAVAASRLDEVLTLDLDDVPTVRAALGERLFDCIVFGDVLEHLRDPWQALAEFRNHLTKDGSVIVSIPNVGFYATLTSVVFQKRWPYRQRGTHDATHLRFFARRNVEALLAQAFLEIADDRPIFRLVERPHRVNLLAPYVAWIPGLRSLLTYQFVLRATGSTHAAAAPLPGDLPPGR